VCVFPHSCGGISLWTTKLNNWNIKPIFEQYRWRITNHQKFVDIYCLWLITFNPSTRLDNATSFWRFDICVPLANIESSDIYGTSSLQNLLIYFIGRHILCGKCHKCLTIKYWRAAAHNKHTKTTPTVIMSTVTDPWLTNTRVPIYNYEVRGFCV